MAFTRVPNNREFAIVLALPYRVDPAAAVLPINEWRGVVLTGEASGTNKPLARLPEAGDTAVQALGIVNSGADSALCGDFPDAAEAHISVVEQGHYPLAVAVGETFAVNDLIALNAAGEAVAATTGIFDTTWTARDAITTAAAGSYINAKLNA